MPADRTWNGSAGDNNFQTAGNWSGGVAPVTGDTAIFNSGSISVLAGLSNAGVNLANIFVTNGYTGKIGVDQANPLIVACSGAVVLCPGSGGDVYLNSGGSNPLVSVYVRPYNYAALIYLMGTITAALLKAGNVKLYSGTFTDVWAEAEDQAQTYLTVENVGATVTRFYANGGSVSQSGATAAMTTLDTSRDTVTITRGTAPTIKVRSGATVYYNTPDGGSGPAVEVMPGARFDVSQDPIAKTIASCILHDNGELAQQNAAGNITYTSAPKNPLGKPTAEALG